MPSPRLAAFGRRRVGRSSAAVLPMATVPPARKQPSLSEAGAGQAHDTGTMLGQLTDLLECSLLCTRRGFHAVHAVMSSPRPQPIGASADATAPAPAPESRASWTHVDALLVGLCAALHRTPAAGRVRLAEQAE